MITAWRPRERARWSEPRTRFFGTHSTNPRPRLDWAARANLAEWTGRAGDAAGARDQYAALLPIMERVLGPEHPDTLTVRAALANLTREADDDVDTGAN